MRLLVSAIIAVGLALASAACSDDGGNALTLGDYFAELEEIEQRFDERDRAIEERLNQIPTDGEFTDDSRANLKDAFEDGIAILREFQEDLEAVNPPAEAADLHNEAIETYGDLITEFDELTVRLDSADSFEDAVSDFSGDTITALEESCTDLEQFASDHDIDVDLDCED